MATNLEKLRERVYGAANPTAEQVQTVRERASTLSPDAPAWARPNRQTDSVLALPTVSSQGVKTGRKKAGKAAEETTKHKPESGTKQGRSGTPGTASRGGWSKEVEEARDYSLRMSLLSAAARGVNQIAQFGGDTLALAEDAVLAPFELLGGQDLGDLSDTAPFNKWAHGIREEGETIAQYYQPNRERGGKGAELLEDLGAATVAAVPQAVVAMLTGGGSVAAQGAAGLSRTAAQAVSPTVANTVREAVSGMARNPNYWTSFAQVVGGSYESALEDMRNQEAEAAFRAMVAGEPYQPPENENAMRAKAALYAIGNGLLNAAVEIGGGIQTLPQELRSGESAWKTWVDTMVDEGKEEAVQGVIERALQNPIYGADNPIFSTKDERAILNPWTASQEFTGGAIVGGILGGGQIGAVRSLNALADLMRVSETRQGARQVEAGQRPYETQNPIAQVPQRGQEPTQSVRTGTDTPTAQTPPTGVENTAPGAGTADSETGRANLLRESGLAAGAAEADIRAAEEISRATGREIRFYDGTARQDPSGRANGYFDGETIYVNSRSANPAAQIIAHEMTHSVELAEAYQELSSLVFDRIQRTGGNLAQLRAEKQDLYARMGEDLQTQERIDQEIVAEYVEHNLLTNEQEILDLTRENPGLGRRILNWMDRVLARLGSGAAQERAFLTRARDTYARALQQTGAVQQPAEPRASAPQQQTTPQTEEAAPTAEPEQQRSREDIRQEVRALREDYAAGRISDEEFDQALDAIMEEEGLEDVSMLDRYSFGGRNAKAADLEALDRAQEMERRGVAADTIFRETGWFQGADGKWRFEIDDSGMEYSRWGDMNRSDRTEYARFRELESKFIDGTITQEEQAELRSLLEEGHGPGRAEEQQTLRLSDFVRHDELYQNYPQLRQAGLQFADLTDGTRGTYNAEANTITLNNSLRDAPEDTLVHEIQHAIQNTEGFAGGSSPEYWRTPREAAIKPEYRERIAEARNRLREVEDRFRQMWPGDTINLDNARKYYALDSLYWKSGSETEQQRYQDRMNTIEEAAREGGWEDLLNDYYNARAERDAALSTGLDARYTPYDAYQNTAGEIEARDVTQRRQLTPEQRRQTMPDTGDENTVFAESGDSYSAEADADALKERQMQIIQETNPADDDYHTWIRSAEEIKTFREAIEDPEWAEYDEYNPDFTRAMAEDAMERGEIEVFSSYPIEAGGFVSPSRMEAESYSGNGRVYSKTVPLTDVAWIDPTQGQYAPVDRTRYSMSEPTDAQQEEADRLLFQGVDADTIRELTGLERTEDGSWRATVDTTPAAGYDGEKRAALTAGEETALLNYKSSDSYKLNAALRDGAILDQAQDRMREDLDAALEKLPAYSGTVYRRLGFDLEGQEALDAFLRAHQVGEIIGYPAYTSTSKAADGYPVEGDLTVTQIIESANGRDLDGIGNNFESEVVFPRESYFTIDRVETDAQGNPVIYMREVTENGTGQLHSEERNRTVQQVPETEELHSDLQGVSERDSQEAPVRERLPGLRGERAGGAEVEPELPDNPLAALMGEDPQIRYSIDEQAEENPLEAAARGTVQMEESAYDALPRKARNYLDRVERRLLNKVGESLSVPRTARRDYLQEITREVSEEYLRDGRVSQETLDSLFDRAYEEGVVTDRDYYDEYQDLRRFLHDARIQISPEDANDIPDFNDFRRSNFGRLNISTKSGRTNVDQIFQELSNRWPEFFNEEQVSAPSDQLQRIAEVAGSFQIVEKKLDEYHGENAAEYRQWAKRDFESAVTEMLGELRNVRRYAEGRTAAEQGQAPTTLEEVNALWATLKEARRTYERTAARNLLTDHDETQVGRLLRGETELQYLDPETDNVRGITEVYQAKQEYERISRLLRQWNQSRKAGLRAQAEQLLETANDWRDKKSGFLYARETMERNIRDIVPDAQLADQIIDTYFTPVHRAAADANRLKNRFREQVRAMDLSRKVADGNIVSEAHAVQLLGEAEDNIRMLQQSRGRRKIRDGKTLEEWQAVVNDLWAENPNLDQGKIRDAVKQFRAIYDQLFQQMNDARVRNGYEPVNYRQGYFPHFQPGDGDGILAAFGRALGVGTEVTALPTTINGMTHAFRPGIRWFGNAQERLGFNTAYDAVEGFDRYIEGVADVIYQTDNIQRLRALATEIRYRTGDEGIRKQIDRVREDPTLDDEDKQNRIDKIVQEGRFALNNFVVDLDEYTNLLANKKSRADRDMEQRLGRGAYNVARALESRVAANMVAINPASWLTNFIPLTQGSALLDRGMILRGMWETLQSYKNGDGIVDRSTFLTNRRGSDPLVQIYEQGAVPDSQLGRAARNVGIAAGRAGDVLSRPMEWIDNFTADSLVRARYRQNLKQGMSEDAAMADADAFAASVMADRSKGATPTMFSRTNPISKLFTQFQLEVNNQLSYVFKDLPREKKELGVRALAAALLKFALGAWLYDEAYEYLIGRRPALDPIGILNDTVGDLTGWEIPNLVELGVGAATGEAPSWQTEQQGLYDTLATLGTATAEELPFIGGLLGGGRLPIGSAIPDLAILARAATDDEWAPEKRIAEAADELENPLTYLVTPFGGGQLKRIFETLNAVRKGGVYTLDAEGNEQLQYPVYNDTWQQAVANWLMGSVFGTTALRTGRDWVESGFDTLGADQTAAYQGMVDIGVPGEDAYELIQSLQGLKDPEKRQALRDADISGEGKSVVYYGLLASDAEMETMDALTDLGADMGEVTRVLMEIKDERQKEGEKRTALEILAGSDLTADQKAEIYRSTASDSKEEKISLAEEYGVSGGDWVEAEEALAREQEEQDADGMTQAIAEGAIRTMEGLTREERAALWQLQNKGWSWQKNPFDRQTGREIYERTHAEDTEG